MNINPTWLAGKFPELSQIAPLGRGGQKVVFSAAHATDGDVVLKLIKPHQSDETVSREILAVNQIQSVRVPQILDRGQVSTPFGDCVWLREQRIVGHTLLEILRGGPLDTPRLLRLGLHMLEALASAEQVSIVHRDVKPGNIMGDASGNFWLLDFGLARHLALSSLTATASPFGKFTPGYAPPEQFRNVKRDIDARSDLFGLGVTLYEAATGTNPFRDGAGDVLDVLRRVETMPLPPLTLTFHQANEFRDFVAAMTQKRRDHRPLTACEALTWMREIHRNEGV